MSFFGVNRHTNCSFFFVLRVVLWFVLWGCGRWDGFIRRSSRGARKVGCVGLVVVTCILVKDLCSYRFRGFSGHYVHRTGRCARGRYPQQVSTCAVVSDVVCSSTRHALRCCCAVRNRLSGRGVRRTSIHRRLGKLLLGRVVGTIRLGGCGRRGVDFYCRCRSRSSNSRDLGFLFNPRRCHDRCDKSGGWGVHVSRGVQVGCVGRGWLFGTYSGTLRD